MKLFRALPIAIFLGVFCVCAQAYEAETDSAWIASQNGGSTEMNDGNSEPNPDCIGDGCDISDNSTNASSQAEPESTQTEPTKKDKPVQTAAKTLDDEEEDEEEEDDDDTYDRYTNEGASISRESREGFSSGFSLGFRVGGGFNMVFLGEEIDDWKIGYEASASIVTLTRLGVSGLYASAELAFSYYRYRYEADLKFDDYSEEDEAILNIVLFEVPVILKYTLGSGNVTLGLGIDLGLKLTGSSKFEQTINTSTLSETDSSDDDMLPSAIVEVGALFEIAYSVNKNFSVDLRVLQRFTNLLNEDVVAVTSLKDSKPLGTHATIGFSLFL